MSKEQKFHKLIQKQDEKGKESLWNKIEEQTGKSEQAELGGGVLAKKQILSKQNLIIICVAALLTLVVGIILICNFIPNKGNNVIDDFRYCEFGDYYSVDSEESISDYATSNNLNLLYFNWYEESLYYADSQFKLKSTDEIICLCEELINESEIKIEQYITDKNIQIDFLSAYSETCTKQINVKSVVINYRSVMNNTFAYFNYDDHSYYFKLEFDDEEYLLTLLEDLIK